MADLSDVLAALKADLIGAVYPNGAQPGTSLVGTDVAFGIGWPNETEVNKITEASKSLVTLYPLDGERNVTMWEHSEQDVPRPNSGIAATVDAYSGNYTLSGKVNANDVIGVLCRNIGYHFALAPEMLATDVASQIAARLPAGVATCDRATIVATETLQLIVSNNGYSMLNLTQTSRRVQIIVLSYDQPTRDAVYKVVSQFVGSSNFFAVITPENANGEAVNIKIDSSTWSDRPQNAGGYQRSLIVLVEWSMTVYNPEYAILFTGVTVNNYILAPSTILGVG